MSESRTASENAPASGGRIPVDLLLPVPVSILAMNGGFTTAKVIPIHDIIMDQRKIMKHLNRQGRINS